jgi:hypothetical protein
LHLSQPQSTPITTLTPIPGGKYGGGGGIAEHCGQSVGRCEGCAGPSQGDSGRDSQRGMKFHSVRFPVAAGFPGYWF